MGAFFTNVHVLAPAERAEAAHTAILDCIRRLASERGLVPCEDDAKADRAFIVRRGGTWLSVYDQATESQDIKLLDELAARLSASSRCPALAVLVHDSDQLLLRLFQDGQLGDEVDCGKTKPTLGRWSKVVSPEKQVALRTALASRDLLSEQTLAQVAAVLGIDADNACTGYEYLTESGVVPEGSAHLRFRLAVRPSYERPAEGPPRLTGIQIMVPISLAVGGALRARGTARNEGGAGRSFYVVAHGPAIDAGLVEAEKVHVTPGRGPHGAGAVLEAPAQRTQLPDGRPCFLADFPEGQIPASNAGGIQALAGLDFKETIELQMKAQIETVVVGRAVARGAGDLIVSLVCREAREHPAHHGYTVTVAPTTRRPLRGKSEDPSDYLPLSSPEAIVALAASTLSRAEAASIAVETVETWSHLWQGQFTLEAAIFGAGRPKKPGRATLKADPLTKGAPWRKVRTAFSEANCVGAEHKVQRTLGEAPRGVDGFAFGGSLIRSIVEATGGESPELPTLRLVVSLEGRTDVRELLDRARGIVDDFVRQARCAQAVLMRCRPGGVAWNLDRSEYETACGIHGLHTLHREWSTRFLRGVSADGIWLGPELLARVDRDALAALCHLEPIGETVRAVLRDGATLDALEGALAPVLPSEADWTEAAEARGAEAREAFRALGFTLGGSSTSRAD